MTITSDRATAAVPEPGQLAYVRDRHWVVTSVTAGALPPDVLAAGDDQRQHLVGLSSVEDEPPPMLRFATAGFWWLRRTQSTADAMRENVAPSSQPKTRTEWSWTLLASP